MTVRAMYGAAAKPTISILEYGKMKQIGENTFKEVVKPKYGNMAGDILEKTKAAEASKKFKLNKELISNLLQNKKIKIGAGIAAGVVALATTIGLIAKAKSKPEEKPDDYCVYTTSV